MQCMNNRNFSNAKILVMQSNPWINMLTNRLWWWLMRWPGERATVSSSMRSLKIGIDHLPRNSLELSSIRKIDSDHWRHSIALWASNELEFDALSNSNTECPMHSMRFDNFAWSIDSNTYPFTKRTNEQKTYEKQHRFFFLLLFLEQSAITFGTILRAPNTQLSVDTNFYQCSSDWKISIDFVKNEPDLPLISFWIFAKLYFSQEKQLIFPKIDSLPSEPKLIFQLPIKLNTFSVEMLKANVTILCSLQYRMYDWNLNNDEKTGANFFSCCFIQLLENMEICKWASERNECDCSCLFLSCAKRQENYDFAKFFFFFF